MGLFQGSAMSDQTEKAFQKQPTIFVGKKRVLGSKKDGKTLRYWKQVGLGFKTPRDAIQGSYIDKKCPFTGNVAIRGRILTGIVQSKKMQRTVVLRRDYLHYIRKYERFEKRHMVTVGQCRPLSKTVRFNVLEIKKKPGAAGKKAFTK